MRLAVQPAHKGGFVPPHPQDGEMPPEGAEWIADQHTLCLLRDGVLKRTPDKAEPEPKAKAEPAAKPAAAKAKRTATKASIEAAPAASPAPLAPPLAPAAPEPASIPDPVTDPAPGAGDAV